MVGEKENPLVAQLVRLPFILLALTMIVPYYLMAIGAFKPVTELIQTPPSFYVENPSFDNFYYPTPNDPRHVPGLFQRFTQAPWRFATPYFNSVVITIITTVVSLLIAAAAAYVLAKGRVPGRNFIFLLIVASMMIPWQVTIIPNFLTMKTFGWINTYQGIIVPGLARAFAVFFLRQYMLGLPDSLIEAARIDGARELRIFRSVILPLVRPALTAMAIFVMLAEWNNFVWPLIMVRDQALLTLPLALADLSGALTSPSNVGVIMVAALLTSLPTVIFFLLFQKQFVEGIALSGVKG
ncbi:carbohydrate ABC transporter permease [soil metagenome]